MSHFPTRFAGFSRIAVLGGVFAAASMFFSHAHAEFKAERDYLRHVDEVPVIPPKTKPPVGQKSIDLALIMFGIEVPLNVSHPLYDPELTDRGLTIRGAFMEKIDVTIGRSAFSSWSLLGSTLAHELEVHCRQNFFFIYAMDMIGMDGTGEAERQAYTHELANARRFGMALRDEDLIADTVAFYYPEGKKSANQEIKSWLARNFLKPNSL